MDGAAPPIDPPEAECPVLMELPLEVGVWVETLDGPLAGMVWVALPPWFATDPPCGRPLGEDAMETGLSTEPCWATPVEM
jgi:hypothetical protein